MTHIVNIQTWCTNMVDRGQISHNSYKKLFFCAGFILHHNIEGVQFENLDYFCIGSCNALLPWVWRACSSLLGRLHISKVSKQNDGYTCASVHCMC